MEHEPITWHALIPGINQLPSHTFHALLATLLILWFAWRATSQLEQARANGTHLVPDEGLTCRNVAELLVTAIESMVAGVLAERGRPYIALFGTFFLFILVNNLMGLVPGFVPATSNFNITFALGIASFLCFIGIGIRTQGFANYAKHFIGPVWWLAWLMIPLEIIDNLVRPLSLGMRLFGNMTGDHMVLEIFTDLTKLIIPVIFYFLGAFVSLIQAFVFTLLSIVYVSLSMGHAHHEEGEHDDAHGHAHGPAEAVAAH
ncbi:MAG TPA: F0F1 ATP synthase subunit A [Candidatus Binatia bacterium]|jgi:F-type H+-transporting ATPase subunit a